MRVFVKSSPVKMCSGKMTISGVSFGRLISCLLAIIISLWVLFSVSAFFFIKVILWHLQNFKLNLIDPVEAMQKLTTKN